MLLLPIYSSDGSVLSSFPHQRVHLTRGTSSGTREGQCASRGPAVQERAGLRALWRRLPYAASTPERRVPVLDGEPQTGTGCSSQAWLPPLPSTQAEPRPPQPSWPRQPPSCPLPRHGSGHPYRRPLHGCPPEPHDLLLSLCSPSEAVPFPCEDGSF